MNWEAGRVQVGQDRASKVVSFLPESFPAALGITMIEPLNKTVKMLDEQGQVVESRSNTKSLVVAYDQDRRQFSGKRISFPWRRSHWYYRSMHLRFDISGTFAFKQTLESYLELGMVTVIKNSVEAKRRARDKWTSRIQEHFGNSKELNDGIRRHNKLGPLYIQHKLSKICKAQRGTWRTRTNDTNVLPTLRPF